MTTKKENCMCTKHELCETIDYPPLNREYLAVEIDKYYGSVSLFRKKSIPSPLCNWPQCFYTDLATSSVFVQGVRKGTKKMNFLHPISCVIVSIYRHAKRTVNRIFTKHKLCERM